MCGRFTYKLTWEELVRLYRLTFDQPARNTRASYNVCPTDPVDTIVEAGGKRDLVPMRWGLIPSWWSKPLKELRLATFNARAETVPRSVQALALPDPAVRVLRVAIDRTSRFAFVQLVKKTGRTSASDFLEALIAAVPTRSTRSSPTMASSSLSRRAMPTARRQDT